MMSRHRLLITAALTLLTAATCSAAQAALVYATYTGTVFFARDPIGVFGLPASHLLGQSIFVEYVIDDATAGASQYLDPPLASGIGGVGAADPVEAFVVLGTRSLHIEADIHGLVRAAGPLSADPVIYHQADGTFGSGTAYAESYILGPLGADFPWNYHTSFSHTVGPHDFAPGEIGVSVAGASANFFYSLDSVTISDVAPSLPPTAVPEPGSWALMIMGLGSIGALIRARRRLRAGCDGDSGQAAPAA
jgi:hypothetical protein